ncbi:MAG: hypothetical protein HY901_19195 [Deltaproteobacteria bacterium]|nr:hypothetical protein [Deltaproteobacteria bacterium]
MANSSEVRKPQEVDERSQQLLELKKRRDRLYATIKRIWEMERASKSIRRSTRGG